MVLDDERVHARLAQAGFHSSILENRGLVLLGWVR